MRLKVEQNKTLDDISVLIQYAEKNQMLGRLVHAVRACGKKIQAQYDNKTVLLNIADIYYFESVDKKTFAYCREKVYRVEGRLYQLNENFSGYGFVQVNKACLLNINVLEHVRTLANSKMEATLKNEERVAISRRYIPNLKEALKGR